MDAGIAVQTDHLALKPIAKMSSAELRHELQQIYHCPQNQCKNAAGMKELLKLKRSQTISGNNGIYL